MSKFYGRHYIAKCLFLNEDKLSYDIAHNQTSSREEKEKKLEENWQNTCRLVEELFKDKY